ncbi:OmpA family protein [Parasulfitobacter algicola]|uniref:OmpA family protein n=1 Tax=Parasulfitobacter algicola TaxID=2614809 RepID=A0ABX2IN52_9RHOB|nr:OmpA family protein [Sulfitobacter algicola]
MRRIFGAAIFVIGIIGLGSWATIKHAPFIEAKIAVRAANNFAILDATHDLITSVSGRDVRVTGLANSAEEKALILADIDQVRGRRAIIDEIEVLSHISPYVFTARKTAFDKSYDGLVPTEKIRAAIGRDIGAEPAQDLILAAGAPDTAWPGVVKLSLDALDALLIGEFTLQDRDLILTGLAKTPEVKTRVETILLGVPFDYSVQTDLDIYIDDRPADFELLYSVVDGVQVNGRVPAGLDTKRLAQVLNVASVSGDIDKSVLSDSGLAQSHLRLLSYWLPDLENARMKIAPNTLEFEVTVSPGIDQEQVETALVSALFPGTQMAVNTIDDMPEADFVRVNAATAKPQIFRAGYWLPVMSFDPTQQVCENLARQALAQQKISFVAGSDRLQTQSARAINEVAAILHECTTVAGLQIEIDGFVDRPGNATRNETLRRDRTLALRQAFVDRGIASEDISPQGLQGGRIVVATTGQSNQEVPIRTHSDPSMPPHMEKATEGK